MEWISVEDRLPRDYMEVLHLSINEVGKKVIMTGHIENGIWTHCCLFYSTMRFNNNVTVTHWMPLPEVPNAMD